VKKKIIAATVICLAALTLAGCASSASAKISDGQVKSRMVKLSDGRSVECVFWVPVDNSGVATANGAQMSCDWVDAK